jgi:arylsulfatase A-like enzyme
MTSIALVVLDTLRKDAFDERFDWLPGRRFENAISTSHWTVPVHASMFAGRYPSELGVHAKAPTLDWPGRTLAEHLSKAGYTTRAYSCNPYVSSPFRFDRGFDAFEGSWRLNAFDPDLFDWNGFIDQTRNQGPERYLKAFNRCVTGNCDTIRSLRYGLSLKLRDIGIGGGIIDDGGRSAVQNVRNTSFGDQEFLFINLMEAHAPYAPPKSYGTTESPSYDNTIATIKGTKIDEALVREAYDGAVDYLADIYQELFAELRASFDIVITVSDHGELFGEYGAWEHVYGVYPELTRVPLVVSGDDYGGRETATTSLLDVHATVCDAAGLENGGRGQSLLGVVEDRPVLTEYHGLQERKMRKLQDQGVPDRTVDLYNQPIKGVAFGSGVYGWESNDGFCVRGDPGELNPQSVLAELVEDLDRRKVSGNDADLSKSVEHQLRDLGYT